ncbi:hypothetical protein PCANC_17863 [Puccinia coronata f. sp. avenae]|uniref:Uncharacterized protein n=1 Tax=Puccinia coronata f. sp. avenae TaxID=200324 RepID=A0A2N5T5W9_9BASI|nr:hypothetical protein PCANC_17776 [Puccinia coronata f. sp. avenae]PLW20870.1 hypothetical protein PCASD_15838 [Puccinia coronata f. sp. avenae]PLW30834.1 hypothetical protein PCASD_15954 [Puccinia coronata f. sp. avenae]PLW33441.1 hypothetical protein PCANC_17863 [Puccinia coronata f. sp. avenae]
MSSHQEEGISSLLSGLQVDNRDRDQTILAHAQSIANLKTQARRTEDIICKNDDTIKELRHLLVLTNDVNKMPVQFLKELQETCNAMDAAVNLLQIRVAQIEQRPDTSAVAISLVNVNVYFGSRRIFVWHWAIWGILGLPVQKALSAADFVIDELYDSKIFLSHIEEVFSNHKEHEDARWALLSLQQGTKSIKDFGRVSKDGGEARVSQLNQKKFQPPQPCVEYCSTTVVAPQKLNEATPMDLDSVLADLGFSFANWRKECTNRALCY